MLEQRNLVGILLKIHRSVSMSNGFCDAIDDSREDAVSAGKRLVQFFQISVSIEIVQPMFDRYEF